MPALRSCLRCAAQRFGIAAINVPRGSRSIAKIAIALAVAAGLAGSVWVAQQNGAQPPERMCRREIRRENFARRGEPRLRRVAPP
jgi:hypothetical protein